MVLDTYNQSIRTIGDELMASAHPIDKHDLTFSLLRQLGQNYNVFFANMSSQLDHLTFDDIVINLRTYDSHLNHQIEFQKTSEFPLFANYSQISVND